MQTRMKTRALRITPETVIKPLLSTTFKASKTSTTRRTIASKKKGASLAESSILESTETVQTDVLMLDVSAGSPSPASSSSDASMDSSTTIDTAALTKTSRKTSRTTRTTRAAAVVQEKVAKKIVDEIRKETTTTTKHPEEDPWKKRPMISPTYATKALEHLAKVDPNLGKVIKNTPFKVYAEKDTNYFRVLSRTIIGQQVHWKAARSILLKFVCFYYPTTTFDNIDHGLYDFPTPQQVIATPLADMRSCGLSERKASYIQDLARHFADGRITFQKPGILPKLTDKEIADQLLCVRGIGPWTVDMFLMFQLERLDILPTLDLGVRRGMELHFKGEYKNGVWGNPALDNDDDEEEEIEADDQGVAEEGDSADGRIKPKTQKKKKKIVFKGKAIKKGEMTIQDMERMAERWRPYRSIGAWYMWRMLDDKITSSI